MTRMIRRFLCLALAAVMMAALLPFAVSGTTAKAASSTGIVTLEGVIITLGRCGSIGVNIGGIYTQILNVNNCLLENYSSKISR